MTANWKSMAGSARLLNSPFQGRYESCKAYLKRLRTDNLLIYYRMEAGLYNVMHRQDELHGGWDAPTSSARGMFTGHWLSAAAACVMEDGDPELKMKLDCILAEIRRCQMENGGWAFSVPEKYLTLLRTGRGVIRNQLYILHKSLMGYMDACLFTQNETALAILEDCAAYFLRWSDGVSREEMDALMNREETGGILQIWAELYGLTGKPEHRELMRRFERPQLYHALLSEPDALTNMHANTVIPEILAVSRCYEVTGEERYLRVALAFWRQAVTEREAFVTGGQSGGEVWTPPHTLANRLGCLTQEHCTVYNMLLLADFLLRETGESIYGDYMEQNLLNGVLAQSFVPVGKIGDFDTARARKEYIVCYYLPLGMDSKKAWGSETEDFWCCHGTAIQANSRHSHHIFYETPDGLAVNLFVPARMTYAGGIITLSRNSQSGNLLDMSPEQERWPLHHPMAELYELQMDFETPREFVLRMRAPGWTEAQLLIDGQPCKAALEKGFITIRQVWSRQKITLRLPTKLVSVALADEPDTVAFMDGPLVLAGLSEGQQELLGEKDDPAGFLRLCEERSFRSWNHSWRTVGQPVNFRLVPLNTITEERYNVYYPVRGRQPSTHYPLPSTRL